MPKRNFRRGEAEFSVPDIAQSEEFDVIEHVTDIMSGSIRLPVTVSDTHEVKEVLTHWSWHRTSDPSIWKLIVSSNDMSDTVVLPTSLRKAINLWEPSTIALCITQTDCAVSVDYFDGEHGAEDGLWVSIDNIQLDPNDSIKQMQDSIYAQVEQYIEDNFVIISKSYYSTLTDTIEQSEFVRLIQRELSAASDNEIRVPLIIPGEDLDAIIAGDPVHCRIGGPFGCYAVSFHIDDLYIPGIDSQYNIDWLDPNNVLEDLVYPAIEALDAKYTIVTGYDWERLLEANLNQCRQTIHDNLGVWYEDDFAYNYTAELDSKIDKLTMYFVIDDPAIPDTASPIKITWSTADYSEIKLLDYFDTVADLLHATSEDLRPIILSKLVENYDDARFKKNLRAAFRRRFPE